MRVSARDGETRRAVYLSLLFSRVAETMRSIVECPPVDMRIPYLPALLHSPAVITLPPTLGVPLPALFPSHPFPRQFDSLSFLPASVSYARAKSDRISSMQLEEEREGRGKERIFTAIHRRNQRDGKKSECIGCGRIEIIGEFSSHEAVSRICVKRDFHATAKPSSLMTIYFNIFSI